MKRAVLLDRTIRRWNNKIYMNKTGTLFLFIGSVILIFVAIIFTAVIDRSKQSGGSDTRARAGRTGDMVLIGQIENYDEAKNVLYVGNMQFADTEGKSLGTWEVIVPSDFNSARFPAGTKVRITASPATFQIGTKTVTAQAIAKN